MDVKLVKPSAVYRAEYLDMYFEWKATDEPFTPFTIGEDPSDFETLLKKLDGYTRGEGIWENFVPHTTYWLVRGDGRVIGGVNIRHYLNDRLRFDGGHIGYGVRPSERGKGYCKEMLRQALAIARGMGISRTLLMCAKENVASARVMIANGAVLDSEDVTKEGEVFQRYSIELGEKK